MIAALAAVALLAGAPLDGAVELPPLVDLTSGASASAPAVRVDPPPSTVAATTAEAPPASGSSAATGGRCVGWEPLLAAFSPGWDVARMSRIMHRESRCRPEVRNRSGATGLLQIMPMHCRWLAGVLGGCSVQLLTDPAYNIRAAAALWLRQSYGAWAATS